MNSFTERHTARSTSTYQTEHLDGDKFIVTSKILLATFGVLFVVILFLTFLHLYTKWVSVETSESRHSGALGSYSFWPAWRRDRSSGLDETDGDMMEVSVIVGLDKSAVEALPTFRYQTDRSRVESAEIGVIDCVICLRDFENGEMGRTLPKCGHSFHLNCIDIWLYSSSTCPLCRAVLESTNEKSSTNSESASAQSCLHSDSTDLSRRFRGRVQPEQTILPQQSQPEQQAEQHTRTEPLPKSQQPLQSAQQQQETAKRADSIPANVLFWGTQSQHWSGDARFSNVVNTSFQLAPFQVAIDIDENPSTAHHDHHHHYIATTTTTTQHATTSDDLNSSLLASLVSPNSRASVSSRRLLSRSRLPHSGDYFHETSPVLSS